jgi:hypothetical protein
MTIVFTDEWHRENAERLQRYYDNLHARRLADLRHRLRTPLPSFMIAPGTPPPRWHEEDAATVQMHVDNLAALLESSKLARKNYANAEALRDALIMNTPLLDVGPGAIGTLGLHARLFAGVVAVFDEQQSQLHGETPP